MEKLKKVIGLQMDSERLCSESSEIKLAVIPLPTDEPDYEVIVPVKLGFSNKITDSIFIRKGILKALASWVDDGPGLISDNDTENGSYTRTIEVGELKEVSEQHEEAEDNDVFATIRWSDEDLIKAFNDAGFDPTPENIKRFKESRAPRTLEERSIEEGWQILEDLIWNTFNNKDKVAEEEE